MLAPGFLGSPQPQAWAETGKKDKAQEVVENSSFPSPLHRELGLEAQGDHGLLRKDGLGFIPHILFVHLLPTTVHLL